MLGRATDKGRAFAAGTNGEYNYDCPMDKAVFGFLGIDADEYLEHIKAGKSDAELESYARSSSRRRRRPKSKSGTRTS